MKDKMSIIRMQKIGKPKDCPTGYRASGRFTIAGRIFYYCSHPKCPLLSKPPRNRQCPDPRKFPKFCPLETLVAIPPPLPILSGLILSKTLDPGRKKKKVINVPAEYIGLGAFENDTGKSIREIAAQTIDHPRKNEKKA